MQIKDTGTPTTKKTVTTTTAKNTKQKDDAYTPTKNDKTPWDVIKNSVTQAYNITSNAISQLGQALHPTTPAPTVPDYYQVKKTDKSLDHVASQLGVPLNQLVTANNTKTLPPAGSYLQTNPALQAVLSYHPNQTPASTSQNYYASLYSGMPSATQKANKNEGRGDPAAQALRTQANSIMQQLATGQIPPQIPSAVLGFITNKNGQPLTLQTALGMGYVMNSNGVLVHANGTNQNKGTGYDSGFAKNADPKNTDPRNTAAYQYYAANNTPFEKQLRWDPTKKKYVQIGTLIKQGKLDVKTGKFYPNGRNKNGKPKHNGGGGNNQPAQAQPQSQAPDTILDIHLGSG